MRGSCAPVLSVQTAQLDGLGDVLSLDLCAGIQVGDGTGHPHHPIVPPGGQAQGVIGRAEQVGGLIGSHTVPADGGSGTGCAFYQLWDADCRCEWYSQPKSVLLWKIKCL